MADKIKICAVTTISKTMDWFVGDIMEKLSQNGYDVTLICNAEEGFIERKSHFAKCIDLKMQRGASIGDMLTMPFKMRKIFKENKYDIVYYMTPNASMYASLGAFLAGIPTRIYAQAGIRYVSFTGIKKVIFKAIEKFTCMFSTHIRSQSPKNREFAISEGLCKADKISVIGIGGTTGVLLEQCDSFDHAQVKNELREKYGISKDTFLFGYVGRINADKGINELIEAFHNLQKENDNISLALVGMLDDANPISPENMKRAEDNPDIFFTGNVPTNEVYQHMAMFDALVHPTYREGFGKVLQEAMGMRLPIITTNVPGPSEVVEKNISGILVDAQDSVALEKAMGDLLGNPQLCSSLASEGRKRAEKYFDRPIMLNNQLEGMNNLIGRKN